MIAATRRALVVGDAYHGARIAALIARHCVGWSAQYVVGGKIGTLRALAALPRASVVVCAGGPGPHSAVCDLAARLRVGVVIVWTGADLVTARCDAEDLALAQARGYVHLADAPWLVDELRALGVSASYLPTTALVPGDAAPLPSPFRVLAHAPSGTDALAAQRTLHAIARALPEVPFSVIGRGERNPAAPSNVTYLGYVKQLDACIDAHCAAVRFSRHDGASPFVLSVLARGRHVVWNYPLDGVRYAPTVTRAIAAIAALHDAHARGLLRANETGRETVRVQCAPDTIGERLARELDGASRAADRTGRTRCVAVSGPQQAAARIISAVRDAAVAWDARPVRTRARLTLLAALGTLHSADAWYSYGLAPSVALELAARAMRKPRVVQWRAEDARRLADGELPRWLVPHARAVHLAENPETAALLASCGIIARVAPPPIRVNAGAELPLPEEFTVLIAPSEDERGAYERLLRACAELPVRLLIVGGVDLRAPWGMRVERLTCAGDALDAYARSTVLVHLSSAEAVPSVVLEALACGRHVIASQPFPFVREARTFEQMCAHIEELARLAAARTLVALHDAAAYVRAEYDPLVCLARVVAAWDEATGPAR